MLNRVQSAFALLSLPLFFFSTVSAQDLILTRSVVGQNDASGTEVQINQIDTSKFPKVHIFATVLRDGAPVEGLSAEDFRVREDEVDQEPLTVVPELGSLTVAVTLDVSGSMKKSLARAQSAASHFIDALQEGDEVLAYSFAREVKRLSFATSNKAQVKDAIASASARGDTALYDALYESIAALDKVAGRKAVILLSDGIDDNGYGAQLSKHSVSDVIELAEKTNVPVFTIGLGTELDEATLRKVADRSGAKYFNAPNANELQALYEGIGKELSGQYNIYYTSNLEGDGSVHRVSLTHDGISDIKTYVSPVDASAQKQEAPKVKHKKMVLQSPIGTITCPEIDNDQSITVFRDGKEVGELRDINRTLKLPAGEYQYEFHTSWIEGDPERFTGLTVKAGETTALPVGRVTLEGLDNEQNVVLLRNGVPFTQLAEVIPFVLVPEGEYSILLRQNIADISEEPFPGFQIAAGQELTLPLATASIDGIDNNQSIIVLRDGEPVGRFGDTIHSLKLPAGRYEFALHQSWVDANDQQRSSTFDLQPNQQFHLPVGSLELKGLSYLQTVLVFREGEQVARSTDEIRKVLLFPGDYEIQIEQFGTQKITIEPHADLQIEFQGETP